MHIILEQYKTLVEFLGQALGIDSPQYPVGHFLSHFK